MSTSDSERTDLGSEGTGLPPLGPLPERHGRGDGQHRVPSTSRRRGAFTSKDILEADELKRVAMSVVEAGGFGSQVEGLDWAWPDHIGSRHPSLAEQLDAERRRDLQRQLDEYCGHRDVSDQSTRSIVAELHGRVAAVAEGIPELPFPEVDRVPDDTIRQTYTKHEGNQKHRAACGLCVNCEWTRARHGSAGGSGGGKRRKTTKRPCLTVSAVTTYENEMGYLNGKDMLRIVETLQGGGAGATGRGVRCGKCRQCLGFQNRGTRSAKCFAVAAVLNETVPRRLLPVVKLAAAEAEDRMLLSYPYIKQVDRLRLTGMEWLIKHKVNGRRQSRDGGTVEEEGLVDVEEACRWGLPNVPSAGEPLRHAGAVEIGNALRHSKFGEAITEFDEALLAAIRERQALMQMHEVPGEDVDEHDAVRGAQALSSLLGEHHERVVTFADAVVGDILYALHVRHAAQSADSTPPAHKPVSILRASLATVRASIIEWGQHTLWMDAMTHAWSCTQLRDQMTTVVAESHALTIKSFLAHCIHKASEMLDSSRQQVPLQTSDTAGQGRERLCGTCGLDHGTVLPTWRIDPVMVKLSDAAHGATPRVLDDIDFSASPSSEAGETADDSCVARVARAVRGPLYRLVEGTLNQTAIHVARRTIPTQFRNKNANDKRIFRERTDVATFPSLPFDALDWYAQQHGATTASTTVSRSIPGCFDPQKISSIIHRAQQATNRLRSGRRGIRTTNGSTSPCGRPSANNDDECDEDDENGVATPAADEEGERSERPLAGGTFVLSPNSAFQRCGDRGSLDRHPDAGADAGRPDRTDPAEHRASPPTQANQRQHPTCQQSIDEMLERVPSDVRLPFLACVGLLDERLAVRSLERYLALSRQ